MSFAAAAGGGAGVHASAACSLLFEEAERSGAKKMLLCGGTILGESTWFWKTQGLSKYSHGINVHKQLKLQKPGGVSYLKGSPSCPNESTWRRRRRLHCLGSWVDAADAASASSDWKPVIDQVLLMATMFLTHMAGVAPFAKPFSKPAPMDLSYDPQVAAHNQTSSGSLENHKQLDSNCAWGIVKGKLIDSLNVVDLESNLNNLNVYDQQPLNRPLSLFAIPKGPRLRLLWTSFDQLQKEVHKIAGSLDTDNMLKWIPVFYEVVQNTSQSVCMDWLEKELSMKNISTDKEFFDLIAEKLEKDETILQNIRRSGKEGLYAELLCFLKFGSLRFKQIWHSCCRCRGRGWKLPDMMFATKRSLSEASSKIAKQLETVYSSIAAAERHLSSRIKRVDDNIDECAKITTATRDEVSDIRGDLEKFGTNVQTVRNAVLTLESKISRIEGKQDETTLGVRKLCSYANSIQTNKPMERIQASPSSSSRSLEPPPVTPLRAVSLPPGTLSLEQPSPSSNGAHKVHRPVHNVASASGLKELHGISEEIEVSSSSDASNKNPALERNNGGLSLGAFGWRKLSGASSFIHRTRSATTSFK